jgi:aryl-alcohol dehydrogenase-like predicted oxidoreductase
MTTGVAAGLARRDLGATGLEVTELGFGAMELRGTLHRNGRPIEPEQADRVLHAVLDAGINLIDTSLDYGASEDHIGRAIAHRRAEYLLATKCGCPLDHQPDAPPGPLPHDYRSDNIRAGVEQSLRRLRTDHLDLLQVHISPSREELERQHVIDTLLRLREQGTVRHIGISATLPHITDHIDINVFETFQIPFSALERDHEEAIVKASDAGAGVIVRGGVARGEPGIGRGGAKRWAAWEDASLDDLLEGESRTQFLLRYSISTPGVSTVIIGTLNTDHLAANVRAATRGALPVDIYAEAKRRLDQLSAAPSA